MEKRPPLKMTPFDMMVTNEAIQMLKLMLPYMPPDFQRMAGMPNFRNFRMPFTISNLLIIIAAEGGCGKKSSHSHPCFRIWGLTSLRMQARLWICLLRL